MKRAAVLLALVACGKKPAPAEKPVFVVHSPGGGESERAWVVGVAQIVEGKPVIAVDDEFARITGSGWTPVQLGTPVIVEGKLVYVARDRYPPGMGDACVHFDYDIAGTSPPAPVPAGEDEGLLAAERAVFAAIARKDGKAITTLLDDSFLLHTWGQKPMLRRQLADAIEAIPGTIRSVDGESLVPHRAGDVGAVEGTQLVRIEVDGRLVEDRTRFIDLFARRGTAWIMTAAVTVTGQKVDLGDATITGDCMP